MTRLPVTRAGRAVSSYLSALGRVRETRLTATFAFLLSRFPERFLPAIGMRLTGAATVTIEETDEGDRYDVLVGGRDQRFIIEGKIDQGQDTRQLERYALSLRRKHGRRPNLVLLDSGRGTRFEPGRKLRKLTTAHRHVTWDLVAKICADIARKRRYRALDPVATAIASDFSDHLLEAGMTNEQPSEIYLRELSTPGSVELYFRHRIYKCQSSFIRSARGNLYFAPYFTAKACKLAADTTLVPIGEGISYVSRILSTDVIPRKRLLATLKARGIRDVAKVFKLITKNHPEKEILVTFLGAPYQLFTTPVSKSQLHRVESSFTPGSLGSRSCSLENLLAASRVTKAR